MVVGHRIMDPPNSEQDEGFESDNDDDMQGFDVLDPNDAAEVLDLGANDEQPEGK